VSRRPVGNVLQTGVCYYPEHWPEARWREDAAHMRRLGLSLVRIGEFAWSRLESPDGTLHMDWLQRAIDTLHEAGLQVVLGTPTATPPAWLCARHPGLHAIDEHGRERGFGSRRHYCFSYTPYHDECRRIVTALATRFGDHPGVVAWQTDNEYGCHDTVLSYSAAAVAGFRHWCARRYNGIEGLNAAWGNVFWSMEYTAFDEIGAPSGAVTETNPAHRLAYWRYCSEQVVTFDRLQVDIIRKHSPGRDVLHNFMGNFVEFDHHAVSRHLDVATWDNYPLGFLTRDGTDPDQQARYLRTGLPDGSAFHHDLYRGCCQGRFWVMEQQPGPVNWAPYNPAPLDGMVRLWGWEAFAHGAEVTSYFRWRQAPFAQEQQHTGLLLSNGDEDVAAGEVGVLNAEVQALLDQPDIDLRTRPASVAIVFDYAGDRLQRIQQPGGQTFDPLDFVQRVHACLRGQGIDVDIVAADAPLSHYRVVLVSNATVSDPALATRLADSDAHLVLFPRVGSRTAEAAIPDELPPGALQRLIDVRVVRTESLPPSERLEAEGAVGNGPGGTPMIVRSWRERLESSLEPRARFADGWGFHYTDGRTHYINAIPTDNSLERLLEQILSDAALTTRTLPVGVRLRQRGNLNFAFNYGPEVQQLDELSGCPADAVLLIGERRLAPAGVAVWRTDAGNA